MTGPWRFSRGYTIVASASEEGEGSSPPSRRGDAGVEWVSRYSGGRPEAGEGLHGPGAGVTGSGYNVADARWDSTGVSGGRPEA